MTDLLACMDFNDAPDQSVIDGQVVDAKALKARLLDRLSEALAYLFPNGKQRGTQFVVGDVQGHIGKSLVVDLQGQKAGIWIDFATGEGGDVLDLWAQVNGLDSQQDFLQIIQSVAHWLGELPLHPVQSPIKKESMDKLGPWSAKWDYHDQDGSLIACVYRYDTAEGKEYRPWNVCARKMRAPNPRPLYNQSELLAASDVVLVEGEKAADALIQHGIVATMAMNGANAPVDKTDWSPLIGKHVLIWPDKDR